MILENSAEKKPLVVLNVIVHVSASRLRRRAPPVIRTAICCRFEVGGRQSPKDRVRPNLVVMPAPLLDADLRIDAVPEPMQRQMLVTELAVEGFVGGRSATVSRVDEAPSRSGRPGASEESPRATNSGPLSERRCCGAPWRLTSCVRTSMTRPERSRRRRQSRDTPA